MSRIFKVEIRDYESGLVHDALSPRRIEGAVKALLDFDGSDGIVIVTEAPIQEATHERTR